MDLETFGTVEYKGIVLSAAAFQVSERQGYFCSVVMTTRDASAEEAGTLVLSNSGADTGLFKSGIDAISAALASGKEIIDAQERELLNEEEARGVRSLTN